MLTCLEGKSGDCQSPRASFSVYMCTHTKCEFMGFCSNMEDKANSSILLDWNTHRQMQHLLLLSIHPPAPIVPAVPAEYFLLVATASLVVSIRSIAQR